jgi:hypothetical protein
MLKMMLAPVWALINLNKDERRQLCIKPGSQTISIGTFLIAFSSSHVRQKADKEHYDSHHTDA